MIAAFLWYCVFLSIMLRQSWCAFFSSVLLWFPSLFLWFHETQRARKSLCLHPRVSVLVIQYVYRETHVVSNLLVVLSWHLAGGQGCGAECTQVGEGEREGAGKEGNRGGGRVWVCMHSCTSTCNRCIGVRARVQACV
jgi:hypothetical protein